MKNSQRSSSSEVETMNEYQQEAELIKSQGLCAAGAKALQEISDSKSEDMSPLQASKKVELNRYRDLYLAALKGNWQTTERIIDENPEALTAKISMLSLTVLHVAVHSGNYKFVEKLVGKMTPEQVAVVDVKGNTALHYAAFNGVVKVAKALLRKNPRLTEVQGSRGFIPLLVAVVHGAAKGKEMVRFLASKTNNPFVEGCSAHLLLELTHAGFHDITLYLLRRFPNMATESIKGSSILSILAVRPTDFPSETRFKFWETWIYQLVPCKPLSGAKGDMEDPRENSADPIDPNSEEWATRVCKWFKLHIWKIITTLAPSTCQKFQDVKWRHKCALELVTFICGRAKEMPYRDFLSYFVGARILYLAAISGIVEIINVCVHHFPDIIWMRCTDGSGNTILDDAVEHRQVFLFNVLCAKSEILISTGAVDCNHPLADKDIDPCKECQPCRMHLAATLAPCSQLSSVSGTALQMQRELQWYKEVEKLAHPSDKEKKVRQEDGQEYTPRELFTKEHKELVEKAEKWMKDTSNSCMVVTTLVATVVFAAAFTIPGGNNSQGVPIFLEHKPFTMFIISDALALFSALTSVLMFLSILTSRYAEEDFLKDLPIKLLIGLVSLFFAIATMMIAFVAALWIVLDDKFKWISIPVTILASIPVTVFLSLQLPLCFQIYRSTFIGIFHPENIWELN